MDEETPFVSVVVPAYNCGETIGPCLTALFQQTYPRDRYEILLVDDGSTDDTAWRATQSAAAWAGKFTLLHKPNGGPASARNAGVRASGATVVAFTDADCVADPDWLTSLIPSLVRGDAVAIGGPIANQAGHGWVSRFLIASQFYRHRVRNGQVEYLITLNLAAKSEALRAIGGFSEVAGAWNEDADLCFRLTQAGYTLLFTEHGSVTHTGLPTSVRALMRKLYLYGRGNYILSGHWPTGRRPLYELARRAVAIALAPMLALRCAPRAGLWWAVAFWPLVVVEHSAFAAGIVRGILENGGRHARG